jgi:alpha-glucosidase
LSALSFVQDFRMKRSLIILCCVVVGLIGCHSPESSNQPSNTKTLTSPDKKISVSISTVGPLKYSVSLSGADILKDGAMGLAFHDGTEIGSNAKLTGASHRSVNTTWHNRFGKHSTVRDHFNEFHLEFTEAAPSNRRFGVIVRAYDDGVAFRYELPEQPGMGEFIIDDERTDFPFPADCLCFAGTNEHGSFRGPEEWNFKRNTIGTLNPNGLFGLPLLVQTPAAWVAVTESDLRDWSGMWLSPRGGALKARLAPRLDHQGLVKASAPHHSPWRVLMIGAEPGRLVESDLVLNLAAPSELYDTSWVKPGMMAWDHWWAGDTQMDTATLEQYIQLAADMGWSYQMIDWKWYGTPDTNTADITRVIPEVDMPGVLRFAKERGVREWAWLHWADVNRNDAYKRAFPLYEKWGFAGVKIDFMDRNDQEMVNWYEKIARAAAEHHLMVDFHGAFQPAGFNRTFPNQITREGIMGNEWNKWSRLVTPEHKLTLPFTRFLAGPGDFTPGGFLNRQPDNFRIVSTNAEVQGTRAAELALFVMFDSPVCCACDSPSHYRNQPGTDFLKIVPTVWDDTRVLDGAVGEHLIMVRRKGEDWFLGAMTDQTPREMPVKLDFLKSGEWTMKLWKDAPDAVTNAEHLETEQRDVRAGDTVILKLAPNGGAVAHFQHQ